MASKSIYHKLREPFDVRFIGWRINNYSSDKTRALITFHIDARAVQHRLNEVLGVDGWSFTFSELEKDQGVHGKLSIKMCPDGEDLMTSEKVTEVTREDVGYATSTDKKEWYKDAVSDALKRCAVHFGVGHFLYALPQLWIDLNQPGQKYLTDKQNEECKSWVETQINKIKKQSLKAKLNS